MSASVGGYCVRRYQRSIYGLGARAGEAVTRLTRFVPSYSADPVCYAPFRLNLPSVPFIRVILTRLVVAYRKALFALGSYNWFGWACGCLCRFG